MRLEGVAKRYHLAGPWVLRDVDAEIAPGDLVRVAGPNGGGKSTLLRLVAGAAAPSRGRVTSRPRTGYVPERFPPALPFTPRGYLTHLGRIHGLRGAALGRAVGSAIDRLALGGYAGTPLRELSKGTCQKVAVAQALLGRPDLLVLDEAWTGLDERARAVLDCAVTGQMAAGAAAVFVDHDPARLADRVSACWTVAGGRVTRAAGPGLDAPGSGTVLIDLAGYPGDRLVLAGLPGVLSALPDGDGTRLRVRVEASDDVLRQVLDGAVTGQVAAGAAAVFVDHDPARLADRVSACWTVAGGRVTRAAGPGLDAPGSGTVLIDLAGYPGDRLVLAGLPGVLSALPDGDGIRLRVRAGASDDVLRQVLAAGPEVHVLSVRPGPARQGQADGARQEQDRQPGQDRPGEPRRAGQP